MRYCLADFFLLQKKKEITAGLIRENKIAGIACRVAASSNNRFHSDGGVLAMWISCVHFQKLLLFNKLRALNPAAREAERYRYLSECQPKIDHL